MFTLKLRNEKRQFLAMGLSFMIVGALFYVVVREGTTLFETLLPSSFVTLHSSPFFVPAFIYGSLPSFLFVIFMSCLTNACIKRAHILTVAMTWLYVGIVFELLQSRDTGLFSDGTFDVIDVIALIMGSISTIFLSAWVSFKNENSETINTRIQEQMSIEQKPRKLKDAKSYTVLVLLSLGAVWGCTPVDYCDGDSVTCVDPVFLSVSEIRQDIEPELGGSGVLLNPGAVTVSENYLLVVDKYRGIHVYDNTDNQNPMRIVYIPLPGALGLSLNGDYIYVSSFMDLVTIDLSAVINGTYSEKSFVRRIDQFFPPEIFDFIPSGYGLNIDYADRLVANGIEEIVIGYRKSGEEYLYGERN